MFRGYTRNVVFCRLAAEQDEQSGRGSRCGHKL
jgi:hypothetical protein